MRHRTSAILLLATTLATACGTVEPEDQLVEARALWSSREPATYEYVYQRTSCECLPEWTRRFRVEVVNDEVVDVEDAIDGTPPPEGFQAPTIRGLFDLIEEALDQGAHQVDVTYHPTLGYPTEIVLDYSAQIADDEFLIRAELLT